MFNKEPGNYMEDCKLKVVYVPPQVQLHVKEGSEEGSSPRALVFKIRTVNISKLNNISRSYNEYKDNLLKTGTNFKANR
ncbi:hypothetical protein KY289_005461 [Solanum tuberosum]|nr:hypothetical protein KY284_005186 [Solanum tuberosum]KAH0722412.1 hypothetical protein KY289_005456 [Solanum tuberosum]KAH0722417.1 hypothetical protein KY289_005461 [Solanum tuberosum]